MNSEELDDDDVETGETESTETTETSRHFVYLLETTDAAVSKRRRAYVGYTTNPTRRLRQHNREIKGGAGRTSGRSWKLVVVVSGFKTRLEALRFEWMLQHPYKSKRCRDVIKERFGLRKKYTAERKREETETILERVEPWRSMGLQLVQYS